MSESLNQEPLEPAPASKEISLTESQSMMAGGMVDLENGPSDFLPNDKLPSMNIVIMIGGTHGDVLPFIGFAHVLQDLGHRVRMATHESHRNVVVSRGIEFYPLAGNPKQLSEFMVQTGGSVGGAVKRMDLAAANTQMVKDIIDTTWPACIEVCPDDPDSKPFVADVIVSNPTTFGHIHIAEALNIPLHIMFPQPWYYGTRDYPHPMMGLSYERKSSINSESYRAWEFVQYQAFLNHVNKWRRNYLGLEQLHGKLMRETLPRCKIPFSAMWSPSFVPKPEDWPEQCRVVGTFNFKERQTKEEIEKAKAAAKFDPIEAGFGDLLEWFENGPKPIFIGFGSMVIQKPEELEKLVKAAAKKAKCRIVVQSGWTDLDVSDCADAEDLDEAVDFTGPLCHNVGRCPHDWLLPNCSAVVHHGGAGTTAAGLKFGLPTFVCPFFADQHMWAEMVFRAGVGPKPCPVKDLKEDLLAERLGELTSEETKAKAEELSKKMLEENGVQGGIDHFLDFLPKNNMYCDVSMIMGETKRAQYCSIRTNLKLSIEVAALMEIHIEKGNGKKWVGALGELEPHKVTDYDLTPPVNGFCAGLISGMIAASQMFRFAVMRAYFFPDKWARKKGVCGCLGAGLLTPLMAMYYMLYALMFVFDAIFLGALNFCFKKEYTGFLSRIFNKAKNKQMNVERLEPERDIIKKAGISETRSVMIDDAVDIALNARYVFAKSKPTKMKFEEAYEIEAHKLKEHLGGLELQSESSSEELKDMVTNMGSEKVSFSKFCWMLSVVLSDEFKKADGQRNVFWDVYGNLYKAQKKVGKKKHQVVKIVKSFESKK